MVGADILREYLVKIGFDIDNPTFAKYQQVMKELESNLDKVASNKAFSILTKGVLAYTGAVVAAATATAGLLDKVSEAQLSYQKYALTMRTSFETAKEMSMAQRALGASYAEIAWIPELTKHFNELRSFARELSPPQDFERRMGQIREVGFEMTKFKIIFEKAAEWLAYEISKYIDFEKVKAWFKKFHDWLKDNLPSISSTIARFLRGVAGTFEVIIKVVESLYKGLKAAIQILPEFGQAMVVFVGVLAAAFKLNPMLASLSLLFLMLEDYWAFMEGKKTGRGSITVFHDLWVALDKSLPMLTKSFSELQKAMKQLFDVKFELGFWNTFEWLISRIAIGISTIVHGVTQLALFASHIASKTEAQAAVKQTWKPILKEARLSDDRAYEEYKRVHRSSMGRQTWETSQPSEYMKVFKLMQQDIESVSGRTWDETIKKMTESANQYRETITSLKEGYGKGAIITPDPNRVPQTTKQSIMIDKSDKYNFKGVPPRSISQESQEGQVPFYDIKINAVNVYTNDPKSFGNEIVKGTRTQVQMRQMQNYGTSTP
jgi:hypothetical protein